LGERAESYILSSFKTFIRNLFLINLIYDTLYCQYGSVYIISRYFEKGLTCNYSACSITTFLLVKFSCIEGAKEASSASVGQTTSRLKQIRIPNNWNLKQSETNVYFIGWLSVLTNCITRSKVNWNPIYPLKIQGKEDNF
jgi:hypothetical protein